MDLKETTGVNSGAGYSDEQIDGGSGVAGVRAAYNGYNPDDGTYVAKGSLAKRHKMVVKPTDTGDDLIDATNAMSNEANAYALMDDNLRQVMAQDALAIGEPTRSGMDNYMMFEYGNSDLDNNQSILTSEDAMYNRHSQESPLRPLANGLVRFGVRTGSTAIMLPLTIANNVAYLFGDNPRWLDTRNFTDATDDLISDINKAIPVYSTKEQEEALANHPLSATAFFSGANVANFIDNYGYTAGSALPMKLFGPAAPWLTAGVAALQVSTAVKRAIDSQSAENGEWYENLGPVLAAVAAAVGTAALPKGLQNGVKVLSTSAIAATGEAETETAHAVNEYIREKTDAIDASISARKAEVIERYTAQMNDIMARMNMALPSQKEGYMQQLEDLKTDMDNQLSILDWQRTKAVNQAVKDSNSTANITRLANYAILTASNAVQFGKLLTGGFKRYATETSAKALDEAMEYAGKRYAKVQAEAGGDVLKQAQNLWNKKKIIQEGLNEYSEKTGKKVLDEGKTLSALEYVPVSLKHPIAEGWEEMSQAMASNAGKAYAERNTDDYYGQISGLDAFRRSESAVMAAATAAVKTLGSEQAWSEFLAGALTGALGMPSLRNPKFKRMTGERDANGNLVETTHWRSPIYFQGGVYGEIRKAQFDRANRGRMAEEINKYLSPEGRKNWQRRMANMAHHMQYQEDKEQIVGMSNGKDKFHWENAEDAELVKTVELFQQTGQMDLLKAFARTELDYETVDELRDLQQRTMSVDKNGDKVGRYTEFDLSDPGENASEAQKQHLNDEMARMKEKIKTDVNRRLEAIDLYADARRKLQQESQQGLTSEAMNVLAWYGTKIGLFDKRTESMYNEHKGGLDTLNGAMEGFFKERHAEVNAQLAEISKARGAESLTEEQKRELDDKEKKLLAMREMLTLAEEEWNERWSRASKVDSPLGRAKVLFTGNEEADPIGGTPAKKPWYLPDKVWARRINAKQSPAARRRAALMGVSLARVGSEGQLYKGVLDLIIDDMGKDEVSSQVLRDAFPDAEARKSFAAALHDMRECQAAIVRYKDLYQFYKDNPYAAEARAKETSDKFDSMAAQATIQAAIERLRKCETVKAMYEEVVKMVKEGYDTDFLNGAIKSLAKEGSEVAKSFLENQKYVRTLFVAVDSIRTDAEDGSEDSHKLAHAVMKELAIEAASNVAGVDAMHEYIKNRLQEITQSPEAFADFLLGSGILTGDREALIRELQSVTAAINVNEYGQFVSEMKNPDGAPIGNVRMDVVRDYLPKLLTVVDNIIKDHIRKRAQYAYGIHIPEHDNEADNNTVANTVVRALPLNPDGTKMMIQGKLSRIGDADESDDYTDRPKKRLDVKPKAEKEAPAAEQAKTESVPEAGQAKEEETPTEEQVDEETAPTAEEEPTAEGQENEESAPAAEQQETEEEPAAEQPEEEEAVPEAKPMEEDEGPTAEEAVAEMARKDANEKDPSSEKFWIPALSFFSTAFKRAGRTVRNAVIGFVNGQETIVGEEKSPFRAFWNMMKGAFDFVDSHKIHKGETVHFVVDTMGKDGKSCLLGLEYEGCKPGDILSYNGAPYVFMCVERDGKYQVVGSMYTSQRKLQETGQAGMYNAIVTMARAAKAKGGTSYVHKETGTVAGVHRGLVETRREPNTLDRVFGGMENILLAVRTVPVDKNDNFTVFSNKGDDASNFSREQIENPEGMTPGRVYALVYDQGLGKYVPIPCNLRHFNKRDEATHGRTATWGRAVDAISQLVDNVIGSIRTNDEFTILNSVAADYEQLGEVLALDGYGIHIDAKVVNGEWRLVVSKPKYKNGKPVFLLDDNGNRRYRKNPDGSLWRDEHGRPQPLVERTFVEIGLNNAVVAKQQLTDTLQSDEFNVPFRLSIEDVKRQSGNVDFETMVKEGIVTTNVVDGGGLRTRGCSVRVSTEHRMEGDPNAGYRSANTRVEKRFGSMTLKKDTKGKYYINGKEIGEYDHFSSDAIESLLNADSGSVQVCEDGRFFSIVRETEYGPLMYTYYSGNDGQAPGFYESICLPISYSGTKKAAELHRQAAALIESNHKRLHDGGDFTSNAVEAAFDILRDAANPENFDLVRDDLDFLRAAKKFIGDCEAAGIIEHEYHNVGILTLPETIDQRLAEAAAEQARTQEQAEKPVTDNAENSETVDKENAASPAAAENEAQEDEERADIPVNLSENETLHQDAAEDAIGGEENSDDAHVDDESEHYDNPVKDEYEQYSIRTKSDNLRERIDIDKELAALRKIVPWLSRDEAVIIIDHLIETGRKGVLAQGKFKEGLMILSSKAVRGTAFHEAFHGIFITALDNKTRNALIEDAKRVYGVTLNSEAEECLADAFRDYMVDRVYGKSWTKRIKDFFRWMFNLVGTGYDALGPTVREVFAKAAESGFSEAGRKFTPFTLKQLRISEYAHLGYSQREIREAELYRSSFNARSPEVQQMIRDAGISEEAFDLLPEKDRDDFVACL